MADESKPQEPKTATSSTNPITELPAGGGVVASPAGGAVAPTSGIVADAAFGPTGGTTLATDPGADVSGKLGAAAPVFGEVLKSIGLAVVDSQKALDEGVIAGVKKLNDTKIKVVTQVVQELNDDGIPDPSKTQLVTNELSVLNFFTPTFHEWKNVELLMDLAVGEFHGEQGVKFHTQQESTSVGGGGGSSPWGFGGWFSVSHAESEQTVKVDHSQDVSWSSGQVHVSALLGPRRTGKFPTPATVEIGPQIFVTQGALSEQKVDNVVKSRSAKIIIQVRKTDGSPMEDGVPINVEAGGLLPDFGEAGSITHNKGRVEVKLTRNLAGGPQGFAKFPLSAALGAKRKAFTVTL